MIHKISIIGTGYMAAKHLSALRQIPTAHLSCIWSTGGSADKAKQLSSEFNIDRTTQVLDQALTDPKSDIVLICTPDDQHTDSVIKSLTAGKHVLCEKPLTRTAGEFSKIKSALDKSGGILQVGMNCRFREQYSIPKKIIDSNQLGPLTYLRGTYVVNMVEAAGKNIKPWMKQFPDGIYPFVHSGGIHCLDLLRWFGGDVKSVFARATGTKIKDRTVKDTVSVSMEFKNGLVCDLLVSAASARPNDFSIEVWGENGSIVDGQIIINGQNSLIEVKQKKMDLILEWEDLFLAIKEKKRPLNSFEEAWNNFQALKAIDKAIDTRSEQLV